MGNDQADKATPYLEASEELYDMTFGDVIAAGRHRDYEDLVEAIRRAMKVEVRSSIRVAMIRETLNAFEEGRRQND